MRRSTASKTSILGLVITVVLAAVCHAQLNVQVQIPRKTYLQGESVKALVKITNNAGRRLVLMSDPRQSWLEIAMRDGKGNDVIPVKPGIFRAARVAPGHTISKEVILSRQFNLQRLGNYSCNIVVRLLDEDQQFTSNRIAFNVTQGSILHSSNVGVPGKPKEQRQYRLITFNIGGSTNLYSQIWDPKIEFARATRNLGSVVLFRRPQAKVDRSLNFHSLYQVNPDRFNHIVIDLKGEVVSFKQFSRTSTTPQLEGSGNGTVYVSGGVPYDAKAVAEQKAKIRKLSDRPKLFR